MIDGELNSMVPGSGVCYSIALDNEVRTLDTLVGGTAQKVPSAQEVV